MDWPLPPELPWPRFLRLLRHPAPPRGWLEAAADLPEVQKRPILLRWIAQHPKLPEHLRMRMLPRLPWRMLTSIAEDASAHPQARASAVERLLVLWGGLSLGERRSLALRAPRPLWPMIWKLRDRGTIQSFLQHQKLGVENLVAMIQPPLLPGHADALAASKWRELSLVAHQVLAAMDRTFQLPEHGLVLGQAAPWIKALDPEERLLAASRLSHPPLRRMTRAWALPQPEDALPPGDVP